MATHVSFLRLLELVAALDRGEAPRREVAEWFTSGVRAWSMASDGSSFLNHLGLSDRVRRSFIAARQRAHLEEALQALVDTTEPGRSDYAIAADFVQAIERTARSMPIENLDGASSLVRSLALALMIPNRIPRSREHWRQRLARKLIPVLVCGSRGEHSDQVTREADMGTGNDQSEHLSREQLEAQWRASEELQAEFPDVGGFVAYSIANQRGQVRLLGRRGAA